jgi:hypothetical protein
MGTTVVQQVQPVSQAAIDPTIHVQPVAFFDSTGAPITLTGTDDVLTGYAVVVGRTNVAATDTVKQAIQKVEGKANTPGDAVGAGYEIDATGGALADTDTLLEMIAKLEKRVADLEGP